VAASFSPVAPGTRLADALAALPLEEGVRWAGAPLALPGRGAR